MLKIRRPLGRRIFNMGIAIPGKTVFLIETAPWISGKLFTFSLAYLPTGHGPSVKNGMTSAARVSYCKKHYRLFVSCTVVASLVIKDPQLDFKWRFDIQWINGIALLLAIRFMVMAVELNTWDITLPTADLIAVNPSSFRWHRWSVRPLHQQQPG